METDTKIHHNQPCEGAEGITCDCTSCNTTGHGTAMLERCLVATGRSDRDYPLLYDKLNEIFGPFHTDRSTDQYRWRRGRSDEVFIPPPTAAQMETGRHATRLETVVLDDGLHDLLLQAAERTDTAKMVPFARAVTDGATSPMSGAIDAAGGVGGRSVDPHVWCSIVTAYRYSRRWRRRYLRRRRTVRSPRYFAICYPRKSTPIVPQAITPSVVRAGFGVLQDAASGTLSDPEINFALRMVALTCCIDVHQHSAVVRTCMMSLRQARGRQHILMPSYEIDLAEVRDRWDRRGNW